MYHYNTWRINIVYFFPGDSYYIVGNATVYVYIIVIRVELL